MATLEGNLMDLANTNGTSAEPGAQRPVDTANACTFQTDYEAKFAVLNQGFPSLFKEMLQEIERLRIKVGQLQTELQREKDEKHELQEARISDTNDASHHIGLLTLLAKLQEIGKSGYSTTEENSSISVEEEHKDNGWHGWLSDLQVAEKALSRALYRLHRPVPIGRTPPKDCVSETDPLPSEITKQEDYPCKEWSKDIDFPVLQTNSTSASLKTYSQSQSVLHREFSPKSGIDNGDWSARPTRTTTPTPDWSPIVNGEIDTLVKKPSYPPPIPRPSQDLLDRIYSTHPRPCFNYYLLRQGCFFKIDCNAPRSIHNHNVKRCQRSHEAEFTPAEIEALRFVAQSLRCKDGVNCIRENCYHGHQCQSTGICRGLAAGTCPFLPEEHPERKLAPGAKTVKDNLIPADDSRDNGVRIYATSVKERRTTKHNPTFTTTWRKVNRTAPDTVATLVFNDLCQILRPDGQPENSNKPEDTDVNKLECKTSSPVLCLLD
ncbi:hypothetical protein EV426DRAFT_579155 [Tirmania nivea]|nr:hypothetical protein EV426DRAFT_579155 [Tirmania nivea]